MAVIQLRIDETSPPTNKATVIDNESDHHHHHHPHEDIIAQSSSSMLNKSTSVLGEKLRPISENVKVSFVLNKIKRKKIIILIAGKSFG